MRILNILITAIIILSGCAVKPTKSIQTKESLVISLSDSDKKEYKLVNQNGRVISRSTGKDKELRFHIPFNANLNQCYLVSNSKGKYLSSDMYRLSFVNEYRAIDRYKKELESMHGGSTERNERYNRFLEDTKSKLNRNRAFSNRRCHLPEEKPWPPKPYTKCTTYKECLEEGGAICYSRFIGLEGCALALNELKVAGMLSSPGCAAAAAELAGEKYDMDDAFVDFLHGVADDVGRELLKSESFWDNLVGLFVVGANYGIKLDKARQCTDNFVETHFGPKRRWIETVNDIRAEPERTRSKCISLVQEHNRYIEEINESGKKIRELSEKLSDVAVVQNNMSKKQVYSPKCISINDEKNKLVVNEVKRYLIGASIEDYVPVNAKNSVGIKITGLTEGMPAKSSGLKQGDVIVKINGNRVKDSSSMINHIQSSGNNVLTLAFLRGDVERVINIKPKAKSVSLVDY